jgi:hypothetical protein
MSSAWQALAGIFSKSLTRMIHVIRSRTLGMVGLSGSRFFSITLAGA